MNATQEEIHSIEIMKTEALSFDAQDTMYWYLAKNYHVRKILEQKMVQELVKSEST